MPRQISPSEVAVLERTLQVGAIGEIEPSIFPSLRSLQVTANCKCGCATVWFGPKGDAANGRILAEALATSNGQNVSVIVWAEGTAIIGLEVVGPGSMPLPEVATVRNYSEA